MAAGYVFAPIMHLPAARRRRQLAWLGAALTLAFVALRATNWYGDPEPWSPQATLTATLLSFVNCEKYPPSLLYLMMTIGPALVALAMLDGMVGTSWRWLDRIGHTPLLYYVAHIYVLHALAVGVAWSMGQDVGWLINSSADKPTGWGYSLPTVYVVAGLVVLALYPVCRWFGALRQRRHHWWLSYL